MRNAGDLAFYQGWLKSSVGSTKHFVRRETLWKRAIAAQPEGPIIFIEFGVARGYIGHYFYETLLDSRSFRWFGFDTFTGLPREWRDLPAGAFSSEGIVPDLPKDAFVWHKGLVEETLTDVIVDEMFSLQGMKFVFFDFDLREPSEFALGKIVNRLSIGDMIYFDEAYDDDERHVIERLLESARQVEVFGSTSTALLLRVIG